MDVPVNVVSGIPADEQEFHFLAQRVVAGAGIIEEGLSLVRFAFESRIVDLLDPLPPIRLHWALLHASFPSTTIPSPASSPA